MRPRLRVAFDPHKTRHIFDDQAMQRLADCCDLASAEPLTSFATPEARAARFVAVLSLAFPDGTSEEFRGEVEGTVVWPPRGDRGFGYDPIFLPHGHSLTFGEMSAGEKHGWDGKGEGLSHRARAFARFARARLGAP